MGNRLSGTLAILAMDRFERLHIYRRFQPTFYVRYVDDTGTIVNEIDEAVRMVQYLNIQHKTIKFELELPSDDRYLPILDTIIRININGSIEYRLHTKQASKKITLHHNSHHLNAVKKAVIRSEFRRADQNSSTENNDAAIKATFEKLTKKPYTTMACELFSGICARLIKPSLLCFCCCCCCCCCCCSAAAAAATTTTTTTNKCSKNLIHK